MGAETISITEYVYQQQVNIVYGRENFIALNMAYRLLSDSQIGAEIMKNILYPAKSVYIKHTLIIIIYLL